MTTNNGLHVVLGASGGAGNAIAHALRDAGLDVRAVNRRGDAAVPAPVERRAADVSTPDGARNAVADATVVYMAAQPPYHRWPVEFPAMLQNVIEATAAAGAKLVMVDNLYGYGPGSSPMGPDTPERAEDAKGAARRTMTQRLLEAHREGRLRVAIGRASDYFGPHADNSAITALAIEPTVDGRKIRWTGDLDVPHSVAYLPDVARAYVTLGTDDRADGAIWVLPHEPAPTGREFLGMVASTLTNEARTGVVTKTMLRLASPFHRISKETLDIAYQWCEPFVVDDTGFQNTFGQFETTPLAEAVATTVRWYRAHGQAPATSPQR